MGVGGERLTSGIDVNSSPRKLSATIETGISEDTVSKSGVLKATGCCVPNSSLRNFENCRRGPSCTTTFNTIVPTLSVSTRLIPPDPFEGFAIAMAVVFSPTAPTGTRMDAVVIRGDGGMAACSIPELVRFLRVSVPTSPAMFPETSVTTAKPDRGVVFWAKPASKPPEKQMMRKIHINERTAFNLLDTILARKWCNRASTSLIDRRERVLASHHETKVK